MSLRISVKQLRKHLPEIINRAAKDDSVCVVEQDGKNIAVIVSPREWRRRTIGDRLDALGSAYRLGRDKQHRIEDLLAKKRLNATERRELDALLAEADEILLRRAKGLDNV